MLGGGTQMFRCPVSGSAGNRIGDGNREGRYGITELAVDGSGPFSLFAAFDAPLIVYGLNSGAAYRFVCLLVPPNWGEGQRQAITGGRSPITGHQKRLGY